MPVRIADETDACEISRLVLSLAHHFCDTTAAELPAWFRDSITEQAVRTRLEDPDYLSYVYVEGKHILAYICIKDRSHLYHLFVREEHQGRGLASLLWEQVLSVTAGQRFTVRSSLNAVPVYRHMGFQEAGPVMCKQGICFQVMEYPV